MEFEIDAMFPHYMIATSNAQFVYFKEQIANYQALRHRASTRHKKTPECWGLFIDGNWRDSNVNLDELLMKSEKAIFEDDSIVMIAQYGFAKKINLPEDN